MNQTEAEAIARRLDLAAEDAGRTIRAIGGERKRELRQIGLSASLTGRVEAAARELETVAPRVAAMIRTYAPELEEAEEEEEGGAGGGEGGEQGAPGAATTGEGEGGGSVDQEGGGGQ